METPEALPSRAVAFAEDILGVSVTPDQETRQLLESEPHLVLKDPEFEEHLALTMLPLRAFAKMRLEARRAQREAGELQHENTKNWNATWQPDIQQKQDLSDRFAHIARRMFVMNHFYNYVRHRDKSWFLKKYQDPDFERIWTGFMSRNLRTDPESDPNDPSHLTKGGRVIKPPGYGKSALVAAFADGVGTGKRVSERDPNPVRTLIITPRQLLVHQLGLNATKGLQRFTPHIKSTAYYQYMRDLSGDAVVMTPEAYVSLYESGELSQQQFDAAVIDEAQLLHGSQVHEAFIQHTKEEGLLALGMTASPDYSESRQLSAILPHHVSTSDLREGIETGYDNPMQCWVINSKSAIKGDGQKEGDDYTDKQLASLRHDMERNLKGILAAKTFVERGMRGIFRCIPGQACAHADDIAEIASQIRVIDPKTKRGRPMQVGVIKSSTREKEVQKTLQKLQEGTIDAIAYVALLDMGLDSDAIRFIVNYASTCSPVTGVQLPGRGARIDPLGRPTQLVEFADKIMNRGRRPFTFLDALGVAEKDFKQGMIIGPARSEHISDGGHESSDNAEHTATRHRTTTEGEGFSRQKLAIDDFPEELAESLGITGEWLMERAKVFAPAYRLPQDGWESGETLLKYLENLLPDELPLSRYALRRLLSSEGVEYMMAKTSKDDYGQLYFDPTAQATLKRLAPTLRVAGPDELTLSGMATKMGVTYHWLQKTVEPLIRTKKVMPAIKRHRVDMQRVRHYDSENQLIVYSHVETLIKNAGVPIFDLVRELGRDVRTLRDFFLSNNFAVSNGLNVRTHKQAQVVTKQAAEAARKAFPVGGKTIPEIAKQIGISPKTVTSYLEQGGYLALPEPGKKNRPVQKFDDDVISEVKRLHQAASRRTPIADLAREWGVPRKALANVAQEYDLASEGQKGAATTVDQDDVAVLKHVAPKPKREYEMDLKTLAAQFNVPEWEVRNKATELKAMGFPGPQPRIVGGTVKAHHDVRMIRALYRQRGLLPPVQLTPAVQRPVMEFDMLAVVERIVPMELIAFLNAKHIKVWPQEMPDGESLLVCESRAQALVHEYVKNLPERPRGKQWVGEIDVVTTLKVSPHIIRDWVAKNKRPQKMMRPTTGFAQRHYQSVDMAELQRYLQAQEKKS